MKMDNRIKNYGLWISLFSLIGIILQSAGAFQRLGLTDSNYSVIVQAVLTILVTLGIVNNPDTENKGFGDDKKEEE